MNAHWWNLGKLNRLPQARKGNNIGIEARKSHSETNKTSTPPPFLKNAEKQKIGQA